MSPYDHRYLDLKFDGDIYGSVTVTVDEEFQKWRLFCLAFGFVVLLAAPIVCSWVPFYYGSSMFISVLLVILFILFQVSIFVLVGIVLGGAARGYWIVRKFITSEDGTVDGGIAQFVKWAMYIIAFTSVLQSSIDTLLAAGAFVSSCALCYFITSFPWSSPETSYGYQEEYSFGYGNNLWNLSKHGATYPKQKRTEFLSRSANMSSKWNTPIKSAGRSETPVKALTDSRSPRSGGRTSVNLQRSYFSTFHKTPDRKKFTKKEWEEFTQESTQQAVNELTASPAFTEWVIKNAGKIKLLPEDRKGIRFHGRMVEREMVNDGFSLFNSR